MPPSFSSKPVIITVVMVTMFHVNIGVAPATGSLSNTTSAALNWLISHQLSDGSYGSCTELETAPAAYALWIAYHDSSNVVLSYNWLKNQMDNSTTYFWVGGPCSPKEADIPGEILYSFDASQNLRMLNLSFVAPKLLGFQESNGGFLGYETSLSQQVTSSIDTSMALWGLIDAAAIPTANQTSAVNYLLSLQNANGSFNLTSTISSDSLYSLGPEPISMTALAVLVLNSANIAASNTHLSSALSYLNKEASMNFSGHVYAASLAALALTAYCNPTDVSEALSFIISQQDSDGGFRDIIRGSTGSNPLDTGWATVALQLANPNCSIGSVGGQIIPIDKIGLMLPYLTFASLLAVATFYGSYMMQRRRDDNK
jgi:prenyltransferase beta subunit